jgi:pilus assembly protein CpaF
VKVIDPRLVDALCRAAEDDDGDADAVVRAHVRRVAPLASTAESEQLVRAAVARLDGLGALDALIHNSDVDEVLVNAGGDIWVERDGTVHSSGRIAAPDLAVVIERILAPLGRRLDRTNPIVDARLPDGSRVCVVVPPVALDGVCLSVRRFRERTLPLDAFCDATVSAVLDELLRRRCNVIVSGATSSGKTSLLNTLLGRTPDGERIVVIEDTAELLPASRHVVRLEARPASPDGLPAVTLEQLVRTALRLRPDRLIVGEVRGPDVFRTHHASGTAGRVTRRAGGSNVAGRYLVLRAALDGRRERAEGSRGGTARRRRLDRTERRVRAHRVAFVWGRWRRRSADRSRRLPGARSLVGASGPLVAAQEVG